MRNLLKTIPNQLTAARLVLIPVMWVLAWLKLPVYIGIGTFASFVTDVLDGHIARRLNQVSEFGGKFDSLADNLLLPSALVWLWLFRPEIYMDNTLICALAITLYFSSLLLGGIKFKRFANLHLYSSKAAAVAMYLFVSHALIVDHYSRILFYIAATMFIVSSSENFLLQLVCTQVNEHMGSLFLVLQRNRSGLSVSLSRDAEKHP
jgi:cardiolipin synthase (CMP-forming)